MGYLHHMAQKPNLLDRLAIRRNRSNYATAKSIMAHSHMMQHELVGLYGVPPERIQVAPPRSYGTLLSPTKRNCRPARQI